MASGTIRKRGNNWYYAFDVGVVNGHRKRIERYGGKTKGEAQETLRKALEEYNTAGNVLKLTQMNVEQYFEYWFENYVKKDLKENTQINYRNILDKYIIPTIGIYKVKTISPAVLQKLMNNLSEGDLAEHSVSIILSVIRQAFKMAVFPYQLIKENPANYVRMPKYFEDKRKTRESLRLINMDQYKQILSITPKANDFYIPLQIAFNSGLRRGEVCGLEWDCVDFSANTIEVKQQMLQPNSKYVKKDTDDKSENTRTVSVGSTLVKLGPPKTEASYRTILVGQTLIDILKEHRKHQMEQRLRYGKYYQESNFVCTKENGTPITPNVIKYQCTRIHNTLGFPFNFHSLRHTHATMLLEHGANIKEIQARLGHKKIETTLDTYTHVTKKMDRETVDIFERMMNNSF